MFLDSPSTFLLGKNKVDTGGIFKTWSFRSYFNDEKMVTALAWQSYLHWLTFMQPLETHVVAPLMGILLKYNFQILSSHSRQGLVEMQQNGNRSWKCLEWFQNYKTKIDAFKDRRDVDKQDGKTTRRQHVFSPYLLEKKLILILILHLTVHEDYRILTE